MNRTEIEPKFNELNLEHLNVFRPSLVTIRELKGKGLIRTKSPFWWGTDYKPDPREYMDFSEFKRRLVHLGIGKFRSFDSAIDHSFTRDVYLYPKPKVPMTILNLDVQGQTLPFMVTARPYHEKELPANPSPGFLEDFKKKIIAKETIWLNYFPDHFFPHIRGLFAGARGSNLFWYELALWGDIGKEQIEKALKRKKLDFLGFFEHRYVEGRTYKKVWWELSPKNIVSMKPVKVDFPYTEVSAEEFIAGKNGDKDLLCFYPLRIPNVEETLPLVISIRTNKESNNRKPAVLGIYAENGYQDSGKRAGILRIRNIELAKLISAKISKDFGIPVDAILFTPQKGRPKYERIPRTSSQKNK